MVTLYDMWNIRMCATPMLLFLSYAIGDCFSSICIGYAAVFETIKQLSIEKVTQSAFN